MDEHPNCPKQEPQQKVQDDYRWTKHRCKSQTDGVVLSVLQEVQDGSRSGLTRQQTELKILRAAKDVIVQRYEPLSQRDPRLLSEPAGDDVSDNDRPVGSAPCEAKRRAKMCTAQADDATQQEKEAPGREECGRSESTLRRLIPPIPETAPIRE